MLALLVGDVYPIFSFPTTMFSLFARRSVQRALTLCTAGVARSRVGTLLPRQQVLALSTTANVQATTRAAPRKTAASKTKTTAKKTATKSAKSPSTKAATKTKKAAKQVPVTLKSAYFFKQTCVGTRVVKLRVELHLSNENRDLYRFATGHPTSSAISERRYQ